MSEVNYNYNYENRVMTISSLSWESVEIAYCTKAVMDGIEPENGKFYRTTDTNKFYFDWGGVHNLLNVDGTSSDLESEIEELREAVESLDIENLSVLVSQANTAASNATAAVSEMNAAKANYDAHIANGDIHVTILEKAVWNAKQDALSTEQLNAIVAVSGKQDALSNASVLSTITSDKVSAWDAVAAGSYDVAGAAETALSSAKSYTDTATSNLVKSVNGETGDVTVRTFTLLDDSIDGINFEGSLKEFCDTLENTLHPQAGTAYLAEVSFMKKVDGDDGYDANEPNNNIGMPFTVGNGELLIYVPVEGLYELEMHSTNAFDNYGNPGKWMAMYQDGTIISPWRGFMAANYEKINVGTSESPSYKYEYIAHNDSDGISKYYLEHIYSPLTSDQIAALTAVSGKQDAFANASILSSISQADIDNWNTEASSTGVSKGYVDSEISTATSDMATQTWVGGQGFLTSHQSLDGYATETYVNNAISGISVTGVSEEFVNNAISTATSDMATQTWVGEQGFLTSHQSLEGYVTTSDVAVVSLPTTSISQDWEETLPTLSVDGYVKANDVIAFVEAAINKKKSDVDEGSESEESVVYAYITGYPLNGTPTNITVLNSYVLNTTGETTIECMSAAEIQTYDSATTDDTEAIKATVNVPTGYSIEYWYQWNSIINEYQEMHNWTTNSRYATTTINGVVYNSYTRSGSTDLVAVGEKQYKIIIKKD